MFKNAVIAMLLSGMRHMTMCEFNIFTFVSFSAVLFFVVWGIEEAVDSHKSRRALQRRFKKKVGQIKITQHQPTKAIS